MSLLRLLIRTFSLLLFVAFGTGFAFSAQGNLVKVSYLTELQEINAQAFNVTNTARAPPASGTNLKKTGIAFAPNGNLRTLGGEETIGVAYARLQSSIATKGTENVTTATSGAANANAQPALKAKLSALQDAQQSAATTRALPDGRVRYYTQEKLARTEGPTRGASFVTEYNPTTGSVKQWMESYDQSGKVIRVHPKSINGQPVDAQHYPPTGAELEAWK